MKVFLIICLSMLSFSLSVQEYDCDETKAPNLQEQKIVTQEKQVTLMKFAVILKEK